MKKKALALLMAAILLLTASFTMAETETNEEETVEVITFSLEKTLESCPGKMVELPEIGLSFFLPDGFTAAQPDTEQEELVAVYEYPHEGSPMTISISAVDWDETQTNDAIMAWLDDEIGECSSGVFSVNGQEAVLARGANDYQDENDVEILTTELAIVSHIGRKLVRIIVREIRTPEECSMGEAVIESMSAIGENK